MFSAIQSLQLSNLIHGDLKPSNILINFDFKKLLNFKR